MSRIANKVQHRVAARLEVRLVSGILVLVRSVHPKRLPTCDKKDRVLTIQKHIKFLVNSNFHLFDDDSDVLNVQDRVQRRGHSSLSTPSIGHYF